VEPFYVLPAVGSLCVCLAGVAARAGVWRDRAAFTLMAAATLVIGGVVASGRDPEVGTRDFVLGIAVGTAGLAVVPLAAYYALGRCVRSKVLIGVVWLVSLVPLGAYLLVVGLVTAALVACGPDDYECPV